MHHNKNVFVTDDDDDYDEDPDFYEPPSPIKDKSPPGKGTISPSNRYSKPETPDRTLNLGTGHTCDLLAMLNRKNPEVALDAQEVSSVAEKEARDEGMAREIKERMVR
jgi:hypothetical protein